MWRAARAEGARKHLNETVVCAVPEELLELVLV
jgi:hypothetical protein